MIEEKINSVNMILTTNNTIVERKIDNSLLPNQTIYVSNINEKIKLDGKDINLPF